MNYHDYFELLYVHTGELVWQVQQRLVRQPSRTLWVMGNGLCHRITEFSHPCVKTTTLFLPRDQLGCASSHRDWIEYLMPFVFQDESWPHVIPAETGIPAQALDLISEIESELPTRSELNRLAVRTYVDVIAMLLARYYETFPATIDLCSRRRRNFDRLKPVFEFVKRKYTGQVFVPEVAELAGMSQSRFMHFFKEVTGQPFKRYLNHFRIAHGQALLNSSGMSIAEVGNAVGFSGSSHFGMVFRKIVGCSPNQYKQVHKSGTQLGISGHRGFPTAGDS
jgi:AraC-like DNA-binding protein